MLQSAEKTRKKISEEEVRVELHPEDLNCLLINGRASRTRVLQEVLRSRRSARSRRFNGIRKSIPGMAVPIVEIELPPGTNSQALTEIPETIFSRKGGKSHYLRGYAPK